MRKLKLYLDTSVISYLFAEDAKEKMEITRTFWEKVVNEEYQIYLSREVLREINNCSQPKRSSMLRKLREINFKLLEDCTEVEKLSIEYIKNKFLPKSSHVDTKHIAHAVISKCDFLISWNFKHLVNNKMENNIKKINVISNYKEIGIASPSIIIERNDSDEGR